MSPFCMDTGTKLWTPLVDDALLQTVPHVNQTLFQIVNVSLNTALHRTSLLVVKSTELWLGLFLRLQIGSNAKRGVSLQ